MKTSLRKGILRTELIIKVILCLVLFLSFSGLVMAASDTIVIDNDNQNNAHTGSADGDMDYYLSNNASIYPIEISFNLDQLPVESASIAIKAYDVDEESGEMDYVFINDSPAGPGQAGSSIGYLSGNNGIWNTTVLEIPLSKLQLGENTITITVTDWWCVQIDWVQLILDGGASDPNISTFSISLDEAVQSGNNVEINARVNIEQSSSTEYYTEYMLTNEDGDNLSSSFGSASSEETTTLSMPLNSPSGTYTVTGLIKDKTTEIIKASDKVTFNFVQNQVPVFGPRFSYTLKPSSLTNNNVNIQVVATNDRPEDTKNVRILHSGMDITSSTLANETTANLTVGISGLYEFEVEFTRNGQVRSNIYEVLVSNIDKIPPTITINNNVSVMEETPDADVLNLIRKAFSLSDNISINPNSHTITPDSNLAQTTADKTITIAAQDTAGNESTEQITLSVKAKPLQITQAVPAVDTGNLTASLSATLDYTGGFDFSESGFVWGVSQNPTVEVSNGKTSVSGGLFKGESITGTASNIVKGVNYYVRAYVKADGTYYYSNQMGFDIGAPQYGSFNVASSGNIPSTGGTATFTISRSSAETEGSQTVYYRTINGTAVGGTHFQHENGSITFADGEYSKTISVSVNGVSQQYGSYPATAYQNADRSFYLEVYKVDGGATVGTNNRTEKFIDLDSAKQAYSVAYNQYNSVGNVDKTSRFITDDGYGSNDTDSVSFSSIQSTDSTYLDATTDYYGLKFDIRVEEDDDGYQWIQVNDGGTELFFTKFEHNTSGYDSTSKVYTFPMSDSEARDIYSSSRVTEIRSEYSLIGNYEAIDIGNTRTVGLKYDASGEGDDDWHKDDFYPSIRAFDTREPQLVGIAPMAGGTYAYGDEIYISLIFDEIIGVAPSGVTIDTNLSSNSFTYVAGKDTNVLVFKGTVDVDGQTFSSVQVSDINIKSTIDDLADYSGSDTSTTSASTAVSANTIRPSINFTGSSSGTLPRHNADVNISNAFSAKYAWSQTTNMPAAGWMDFSNTAGEVLTETLTDGTWYLHVLTTHSNSNTRWAYHSFDFEQPTMSLALDNTNWAQSREINLAVTNSVNAPVTVEMIGPETGTYNSSQIINVTTDGNYTFTLTDGFGSKIVKSVEVSKVDITSPAININEYGDNSIVYTSLDFAVAASDELGGSGLTSLKYAWSDSTTIPVSGWTALAVNGGTIPTYDTAGTAYLHLRAVDNAGNTSNVYSLGYTVINNIPPTMEVVFTNGSLSDWQHGSISLDYTVTTAVGAGAISFINAANNRLEGTNLPSSYPASVDVTKNGLYTLIAVDENGLSGTDTILVNYLDNEAPTASFSFGSGESASSWAQQKTTTITVNDNTSPQLDPDGNITGYSGSGVSSIELKEGDSGSYNIINNGDSFTTSHDITYYIRVTDQVGNVKEYTLPIVGLDTTAPTVSMTTPTEWQGSVYSAVVNSSDDYSGVKSIQYAVAANNSTVPESLSVLPQISGSIDISAQGSNYVYYLLTDYAGNKTSGWSDEIKIDTVKPQLNNKADKGTIDGELYNSGEWTNENIVFSLSNDISQLSGTTYKVSIAGGTWETINDTYTITNDTNAEYRFKAVSGGGIESDISSYIVNIDSIAPTITLNPVITEPTNQNITITADINDNIGINIMKWASGAQNVAYFATDGTTLSGMEFDVSTNDSYTVYAIDEAGNEIVETIDISNIVRTPPTVRFETSAATQGTKVILDTTSPAVVSTAEYQWTTSATFPTSGSWTSFDSGDILTQSSDTEYLHIRVIDNAGNLNEVTSNSEFSWGPESQEEGLVLSFTDTSSSSLGDIVSWEWDFGDGNTSNVQNPYHSYADNGSYTVILKVTDVEGNIDIIRHILSIINVAPTAIVNDNSPVDEGQPVTLTLGQTDPGTADTFTYSYDWNNDGDYTDPDEITNSSNNTASYTFKNYGKHTVGVKVTDDDGASDIMVTTVTVNDVIPTVKMENISGNEGDSLTLTALSSGYSEDSYEYRFLDDTDNGILQDWSTSNTYINAQDDEGILGVRVEIRDEDGDNPDDVDDSTLANMTWNNVAPNAEDMTVTTNEDNHYIFSLEDFGFSDITGVDTMDRVMITALESNGSLELRINGDENQQLVINEEINRADIEVGNLVFIPEADANGNGYDSFQFKVHDGTDYSENSYTMTIDVTAVNDTSVLDQIGDKVVREGEKLNFKVVARDIDTASSELTIEANGLPIKASFEEDSNQGEDINIIKGEFSWQPSYDVVQDKKFKEYEIIFIVSDGELNEPETETIIIIVNNVERPQMVFKKEAIDTNGGGVLLPDEEITYRMTLTNIGQVALENAIIQASIPSNTKYVQGSTKLNGVLVDDITGETPLVKGMLINSPGAEKGLVLNTADSEVIVEYTVKISPVVVAGTVISSQGVLSGKGVNSNPIKPILSDDSATESKSDATKSIVGSNPVINASKTVSLVPDTEGELVASEEFSANDEVSSGDILRYSVTISNIGYGTATGVRLVDKIPENTSFVGFSNANNVDGNIGAVSIITTTTGEEMNADLPYHINDKGEIVVEIEKLEQQTSVNFEFDVQVDEFENEEQTPNVIVSQGVVSSAETPDELTDADGDISNGSQATQISIGKFPIIEGIMSIKDINGGEVLPGDELEFKIVFENIGNTHAVDLNIRSIIPQEVEYIPGSTVINGQVIDDSNGNSILDTEEADEGYNYGVILVGEKLHITYRAIVPVITVSTTSSNNNATTTMNNTVANSATTDDNLIIGHAIYTAYTGLNNSIKITGTTEYDDNDANKIENGQAVVEIGSSPGSTSIIGSLEEKEGFNPDSWKVELYHKEKLVDTRVSTSDGNYSFKGVNPGEGYKLVLVHPESDVVYSISEVGEISSGTEKIMGDLPMDPSGIIYDSIAREAVSGVVVHLHDSNGPVPDDYLLAGQQGQHTGSDGRYRFDLRIGSTAPEGEYQIVLTPPDGYNQHFPSVIIEPEFNPDVHKGESPAYKVVADDSVPADGEDTTYYLNFNLADGDPDIINNHIPIDPDLAKGLSLSKSADQNSVSIGDFVTYTIKVENKMSVEMGPFTIEDILPIGFKYMEGTARLDGEKISTEGVRPIYWQGLSLDAGEALEIKYTLVVGTGLNVGESAVNKARTVHDITELMISNQVEAVVEVRGEPLFNNSIILGKVFYDVNRDGVQSEGEDGLADIGIYTVSGQYIRTDSHGRFNINVEAISGTIGSNFILKLDENTLPKDVELNSENPIVIRLTPGIMRKVNFEIIK